MRKPMLRAAHHKHDLASDNKLLKSSQVVRSINMSRAERAGERTPAGLAQANWFL